LDIGEIDDKDLDNVNFEESKHPDPEPQTSKDVEMNPIE